MFLLEPEETRYDLRWRMLGTNVRVHPMFWLMCVVLGWEEAFSPFGGGIPILLIWITCTFFSILLHELGHVIVGRIFGSRGHIVLYSFGGLAIGSNQLARRWQRVLVLFAGPLAQLVLYIGLVFFKTYDDQYRFVARAGEAAALIDKALEMLRFINLIWPLLNLLPIWPLDGGQITREVFQVIMPARGVTFSLGISMVVSGLFAVHMLMSTKERFLIPYVPRGGMLSAIFFAMLCMSSFMALQAENQRRRQWSDEDWPWQR